MDHFKGHFPGKPGLAGCPLLLSHAYPEHPHRSGQNSSYILWHIETRSSLGASPLSSSLSLHRHKHTSLDL